MMRNLVRTGQPLILALHYARVAREFFRGSFWSIVLLRAWRGLRVGKGFHIIGNAKIGKTVTIGRNVKLYSNIVIGSGTIIGDNVELRCNKNQEIFVGETCTVNRGTVIIGNVLIGNNCLIAPNCILAGSNHIFADDSIPINKQGVKSKGIVIGENVWIGASSVILDGITIGAGSVIGAGSIVTKDIPKSVIAVGNPCRVIKIRRNEQSQDQNA